MQRRRFLTLVLGAPAALALAGCGFRLRGYGSDGTGLDELALAGADSELARLVRRRLQTGGTRVHDAADTVLYLGEETFRERRLGVQDAGSQELELQLGLLVSLRRRDGGYRLEPQRLETTTRITVSDDLLGADVRRAEARQDLRQALADQILARLRALGES